MTGIDMRYSASTRGFYPEDFGGELPDDLVEISAEYHAQLMAAQNMGAEIRPDVNGVPQAVFPEPPSAAELLEAERAHMTLTRLQFALQAMLSGVMTAAETEAFVGPRAVPQIGEDALLLVEDIALRQVARVRLIGFERLYRNDPFLVPFQAAVQWTDEQVDEFFRAGALL